MKSKPEVREMARALRREGKSVRVIAKELGVSKGSVSLWVRDIELTQEQKDVLNSSMSFSLNREVATKALSQKYLSLRKEFQENGRKLAKKNDPEFIAGCMLYWAEGSKRRNQLVFTNSDVNMLLLFLRFLKKFFHLTDDDISLTCHFYINDGVSFEEVEKYWDEKLGLPKFCFRKTTVNKLPRKSNTKRKLTTRYGVCKIIVNKVEVLQSIYGGIQEFAGFTNNDWVTGKW